MAARRSWLEFAWGFELAKNIQNLIHQPDLGRRLGKAGNQRLKDEFNRTLWLSRINAVYQKALSVS
jgi:hypothetical protein